jgi:hypothetical protein
MALLAVQFALLESMHWRMHQLALIALLERGEQQLD